MTTAYRTRFAPSPTGALHLGHAYSALVAYARAQAAEGTFLLRIDDLDRARSKREWEDQLKDDLAWLGLTWPEPCRRESEHLAEYTAALDRLWSAGLLYPCSCSRRDIREAMSAPQEGALPAGPDGLIYPGTCRSKTRPKHRPVDATLRLDMTAAIAGLGENLFFTETGVLAEPGQITTPKQSMPTRLGDVVLARRDGEAAYHLAVVIDDDAQGITEVVRGADLFDATQIHVLLQRLLDLPTPRYHHHRLIRDDQGKRLAKRDDARALQSYRALGLSAKDIQMRLGL